MDKAVVNAVKTNFFCLSTPTVKSRVHFFPSAGSTGGHYPVSCQVTVFGKGIERRSVQLDGGRLNQPDGIRLEDAFPALNVETTGICGVEMCLVCQQGRVSLLRSRVVVEMVSPQFALAYSADTFKPMDCPEFDGSAGASNDSEVRIGIGFHDSSMSSSLIVINSGDETFRPDFFHAVANADAPFPIGTVAPSSVVEFPLDETLCKTDGVRSALWGETRMEKLWSPTLSKVHSVACYMLYRDPVTRRPLSVCAL